VKPLEAFPPVRRGEPKLQTWCRECFAEANARNYRKNHEREKARIYRNAAVRLEFNRARLVSYLREHPCVDCGETDIVVLQFDHLRDKKRNVAQMLNGGWTWPTTPMTDFPYRSQSAGTRQWICLVCQRDVARAWYLRRVPGAKRLTGYGTRLRESLIARVDAYLLGHPCVDCGELDPLLLDFDHLRDKVDDVATMVCNARPWSEIEAEIEKCEVRCANCHARRRSYKLAFL
jgi:hypothetical protein